MGSRTRHRQMDLEPVTIHPRRQGAPCRCSIRSIRRQWKYVVGRRVAGPPASLAAAILHPPEPFWTTASPTRRVERPFGPIAGKACLSRGRWRPRRARLQLKRQRFQELMFASYPPSSQKARSAQNRLWAHFIPASFSNLLGWFGWFQRTAFFAAIGLSTDRAELSTACEDPITCSMR